MSKSRTQIEQKSKQNITVHDVAKWTYKCKKSKVIWATIQWLNKNNLLKESGLHLIHDGYKGKNGILKITTTDLTTEGNLIMHHCYPLIQEKYDKVDTILSRCSKRL